jgi:sugar/nucleoside kinase (ribokinase family)
MIEYAIYGKTIIDNIRLLDGTLARGVLGGGGPQAVFGARLWNEHVGFLTRYGADIPQDAIAMLEGLDVDLRGNVRYADLPTLRGGLAYNDAQHLIPSTFEELDSNLRQSVWDGMLSRAIPLPQEYRKARAIHLITEYWNEPMVQDALAMKANGAIFSLEPLVGWGDWSRGEPLKEVLPLVDIVTPDFPAASHLAGSDDPLQVMKYWSKLGSHAVAVRNAQYGSYAWDCSHDEIWHIPIIPVNVVDPTGAGNSYGGGWCVGWTEKRDARMAGCYGAVSASFLVERVGLPRMTPELRREAQWRLEQALENVKRL